jgi:NADH-quinone oxidoreductase subunit J
MIDPVQNALLIVLAVPLLLTALGVVFAKNPVGAAVSLVGAFFFLAGMYLVLTAHLIAFLQVLVYAGAIMVLFLFVIMLLTTADEAIERARLKFMHLGGVLGAFGLLAVIAFALFGDRSADFQGLGLPDAFPVVKDSFGTVQAVGRVLFTQYLLPFEATSLLLLVAIVGAVVVAKQRI